MRESLVNVVINEFDYTTVLGGWRAIKEEEVAYSIEKSRRHMYEWSGDSRNNSLASGWSLT